MNIDLKEYNFRFIFPAAIFLLMSLLLFPEKVDLLASRYGVIVGGKIYFIIITAVVAGLSISALGGILITVFDYISKPRWYEARKEYSYWKELGNSTRDNEFLRDKIQRRWEYFVANLNAATAHLSVLTIGWFVCSDDNTTVKLIMVSLILVHLYHAIRSYATAREFAEMVEVKIPQTNTQ
jgi:hypothetical protein